MRVFHCFLLTLRNPPKPTLFPYTTLFRSTTKSKKKDTFKQLVLRNLNSKEEVSFPHVDKYRFSDDGTYLVYSIKYEGKKKKANDEENETEDVDTTEVEESHLEGVYVVERSEERRVGKERRDGGWESGGKIVRER